MIKDLQKLKKHELFEEIESLQPRLKASEDEYLRVRKTNNELLEKQALHLRYLELLEKTHNTNQQPPF